MVIGFVHNLSRREVSGSSIGWSKEFCNASEHRYPSSGVFPMHGLLLCGMYQWNSRLGRLRSGKKSCQRGIIGSDLGSLSHAVKNDWTVSTDISTHLLVGRLS